MIYLMRHGEDAPERYGGWSLYGLTDTGRQQVHAAKSRLEDKGIVRIYSSDLPRTKETADIVSEHLGLPVIKLPQFREVNNGRLAGLLKSEGSRRYPGLYWRNFSWTEAWPDGESPEAFYHRIRAAWMEFRQTVGEETVLLVTHNGVINVILCLERNQAYTNQKLQYPIEYAGIVSVS